MQPEPLEPDDPRLGQMLDLIRRAFSEHDGRIAPPSSMHRLSLDDLVRAAARAECWVIGDPLVACVMLSEQDGALYLSKLAVEPSLRNSGLAHRLIETAENVARKRDQSALTLQTRIELTDNHAAFEAMGFRKVGETSHPGFDRPTSIKMQKDLAD